MGGTSTWNRRLGWDRGSRLVRFFWPALQDTSPLPLSSFAPPFGFSQTVPSFSFCARAVGSAGATGILCVPRHMCLPPLIRISSATRPSLRLDRSTISDFTHHVSVVAPLSSEGGYIVRVLVVRMRCRPKTLARSCNALDFLRSSVRSGMSVVCGVRRSGIGVCRGFVQWCLRAGWSLCVGIERCACVVQGLLGWSDSILFEEVPGSCA